MGTLDEALSLAPDGPDRWRGFADPDHESANGMFGGWTAALSMAAVLRSAGGQRQPSALTVNYVGTITPGSDVIVETEHLGGSRSIDHWRTDVRATEGGEPLASTMVVLTARRPTDPHCQWVMPAAPDPDMLEEPQPPGRQGQQTVIRKISGEWGTGDSVSSHWIRMASSRPVDHLQLAYLADQMAPRPFYWGDGGHRPSATLTMSVYFHGTDAELTAAGGDYLLNEATGSRGEHATSGQQARLWSRAGALLATTEQLCWYR